MAKISIPHVSWRNGRPRFVPAKTLRAQGHHSHDLKNADGSWMTEGEALDWSRAFSKKLKGERRQAKNVAAELREIRAAPLAKSYTVADMMADWLGSVHVLSRSANTIRDYRQKTRVIEDYHLWIRRADEGRLEDKEKMPDRKDRAIAAIWTMEAAALSTPICYGLWEELYRKRRNHTANAVLTCMGMAFSYAQKKGHVDPDRRNPAHKLGKITPKVKIRYGEPDEIEALIAAADRLERPEIGDMVALGVWIGQRQGDRLALRNGQIKDGRFVLEQSKTGALVSIPLAPALAKRLALSRRRRMAAEKSLERVILDETNGFEPFKADWYRHVFATVRAEAAKNCPSVARLRDKDLRATAVMWLAQAGSTNTQIAAITGHTLATVDQILKHYWAASAAQADDAMAKLIAWHQKQQD